MERIHNESIIHSYLRIHRLHRFFSGFSEEEIQLYRFYKGEMIYINGEEITNMYFVVDGKVKIYTNTMDDKRLILRFQKALAVIGDIEFIYNDPAMHSVEASSECLAISVPYRIIREKLGKNPDFLHYLLETVTQKFRSKTTSATLNLLYPVEVRFASYLLSVSNGYSDPIFHEEMKDISLVDISETIGTSYRHLNRVIQKLSQEGIIKRGKQGIQIIDMDKLKEIAQDNIYE